MWILFALGASLLWGLTYVLNEQIYRKISVIGALTITALASFIVMLIVSYSSGILKRDWATITTSRSLTYLIIAEVITFILAELLIGFSITAKSATLAGLIEISYPIFIALFAYILYRENQLNLPTIIGGALIFAGVFVIYYFNK